MTKHIEYCSYKGLTPIVIYITFLQFVSIEYCSYKGLTHKRNCK